MQEKIRNFCIIAHIDSGKSTLADRFLELTNTIEKRKMKEQFLDQMDLEREKGITIKMQPVRMRYKEYVLNLIDTPGHVDFSYEVSRSLAAVEGAILLVDATKGVQAQTFANLNLAKKQGLVIIPAVNKIDSPLAQTEEVIKEVAGLLKIDEREIFQISAKDGINIEQLLDAVVKIVPAPKGSRESSLRALVFDSVYDSYRGVVVYVRVVDGEVSANDKICLLATNIQGSTKEVGYFLPQEKSADILFAGEIGYIATGFKDPEQVRIGDTIASPKASVQPLAGYQIPKPMVFVSFYPQDVDDFDALKAALIQLKLNDPALSFETETKEALGRGFACGFLGVLHSEIIAERIQREFSIDIIISRPSVEYRIYDKKGKEIIVKTPTDWPNPQIIGEIQEPWVRLEVMCPLASFSQVSQLLLPMGAEQKDVKDIGENRLLAVYEIPLREIVADLYDKLKGATSGLASMDYEITEWRKADLVKVEIWLAGIVEEALSAVVPREQAYKEGKAILEKLKSALPPQLFEVALQAVVDGRVIARETMKAQRRDVTGALYGGDITRKKKLLERQKKGKKELKAKGKVIIPSKVFLEMFRT